MKTNYENIPELETLLKRKEKNNREIKSILIKFTSPVLFNNKNMINYLNEIDKLLIYLFHSVEVIKNWTHLTK